MAQNFNNMKKRFRIQFDFDYTGTPNTVEGDSQTVPDLNLTVRQLVEGFTREIPTHEPLYFDTTIPQIRDITDVDNYKNWLKERTLEVEKWIEDEKTAAEEAKKQKDLQILADQNGQTQIPD